MVTKQDVLKTILNIAHDLTYTEIPKDITLNSPVRSIYFSMEMDSLDEIETIMKLEDHYGIKISDDEVMAYRDKTLDEFCGFVCSLINPTPQNPSISLSAKIKQFFHRTK